MEIRDVLARRSDLSTFLVHLTRQSDQNSAKDNLTSIIQHDQIEARNTYGIAKSKLAALNIDEPNQYCVCFTETPLEYTNLLLEPIQNRQVHFEPYGIAFPKKLGRSRGINPVWYVDITPGHDWLTTPVNQLIDSALSQGNFPASQIAKLTPFIEQMGTRTDGGEGVNYRKEFWWEREWRYVGNFRLPQRIIILCPENEISEFRTLVESDPFGSQATFLDPRWGLEQIISRLAGFHPTESEII